MDTHEFDDVESIRKETARIQADTARIKARTAFIDEDTERLQKSTATMIRHTKILSYCSMSLLIFSFIVLLVKLFF